MKTWLSDLFATRRRPIRNPLGMTPLLETLENRDAPAITVGPLINITKSAGNDHETAIVINPTNPANLFATATLGNPATYTLDGGKTWQQSDTSKLAPTAGDQQMAWDNYGNLFLTQFGAGLSSIVALSTDGGATFSLLFDSGGSSDQPSIAAGAGIVVMDWNEGGRMQAVVAPVSGLGQVGAFSAKQTAPGNGTFGDVAIGPNGQFMLVYQENDGGEGPVGKFAALDPDGIGPMGFGPIINLGQSNVGAFDTIPAQPNRTIDAELNLAWDRSGGPNNGRLYLVYVEELVDESSDTDVFIQYTDDNGATWSSKTRVNDDVLGNGKSQFMPAIAVDQTNGDVAVTWYDCRNSPGNDTVQVFASLSRDGGLTWEANTQLSQGFSSSTVGGGFDFGDYDKMDFHGGVFYRSWADNTNATGDNPGGTGSFDIYTAECKTSQPPVIISLSATPNNVVEGQIVTLNGVFTDPDSATDPFSIVIRWGDGTPAETLTVSPGKFNFVAKHKLVDDKGGSITINVDVIDADGNMDSGKVTIGTQNSPPSVVITAVPTIVKNEGAKISLGSFVTDSGTNDSFSYNWTVLKNGVLFAPDTAGAGLSFTPDDEGTYGVTLQVADDDGGLSNIASATIRVKNVAPTADKLTNDGAKKPGETIRLSLINPTDAAADIPNLRYDFDFNGDGKWDVVGSATPFADTTYAKAGFYVAKARVRDMELGTVLGGTGISTIYTSDVIISNTGGGNGGVVTTRFIVAGSDGIANSSIGAASTVKVFDLDGVLKWTLDPLGRFYRGGYRVATGDVNGDKIEDIIVAPNGGGGEAVFVFDGSTGNELFQLTPYGASFNGGFYVTAGDLNKDGFADIVISPAAGAVGAITGYNGATQAKMFAFSPFGGTYKGGVTLALGDVNGDRWLDLVAGQATVGSRVSVYSIANGTLRTAALKTFNAMPVGYNGGVSVASGDLDGDGLAEIIAGSGFAVNLESKVAIYNGGTYTLRQIMTPFGGYRMGLRVAVEDIDGDGKADILMSSAQYSATLGTTPRILGLKGSTLTGLLSINLTDAVFQGGVFVG